MKKKQVYETIDRDVARRYQVGSRIGRGFYGVVFEAVTVGDLEMSVKVAMKKVLNAFKNQNDAQRTYREVMYLLEFGRHQNIIQLQDVLSSPDDKHLYLVMDLMDSDLQKALRCQALTEVHWPLVSYQVLCALKYVHSAGVMHRDIKPANVLIDASCRCRLADFGWAREAPSVAERDMGVEGTMTEYATTRWYRSPEQLLGSRCYGTAVDIWALGCLAGEMHMQGPLLPGTSTIDMMERVVEMLGKPTSFDIIALEAPYADYALESLPSVPPHKPLDKKFPHKQEKDLFFLDFVQLLMQINPEKRLTAVEALKHPYVGPFHHPGQEPLFGRRVALVLPDTLKLSCSQYREQIYADAIGHEASRRRVAERQRKAKRDYGD